MTDKYLRCASQHFGMWAVEPRWFGGMFAAYQAGTLARVDDDYWEESGGYSMLAPHVAGIPVIGQITKGGSSFGGASSVAIRKSLRDAVADSDVRAIVMKFDSPGGTVAGTPELADAIREANGKKPVHAYAEDHMASAALWAGSQARSISANATAEVGSIGVFAVVEDSSGMADKMGIKVHVVSSGPLKGAGLPGVPVTDEMLEAEREIVTGLADAFISTVAAGRKISPDAVRELADGRVWLAPKAVELGLVDRIEPLDTMVSRVASSVAGRAVR